MSRSQKHRYGSCFRWRQFETKETWLFSSSWHSVISPHWNSPSIQKITKGVSASSKRLCFSRVLKRDVFLFKGLSKFAKLARSVTRSRQFSSHLPTIKDSAKQSNLAHVSLSTYRKATSFDGFNLSVSSRVLPLLLIIPPPTHRWCHLVLI